MCDPQTFDSRDSRYKRPYGAVPSGTRVELALRPPRAGGFSAAFCRCIGRNGLSSKPGYHGGNIDDLPISFFQHDFSCLLAEDKYGIQIHIQNLIPFLNREHFRAVAPLNAMGSHKNVQIISQLFHTFLKTAVHFLTHCQIGFYTMTLVASFLKLFRCFMDLMGCSHNDHLTAGLHKAFCHSVSKTSCSACHDRFFSFYVK